MTKDSKRSMDSRKAFLGMEKKRAFALAMADALRDILILERRRAAN